LVLTKFYILNKISEGKVKNGKTDVIRIKNQKNDFNLPFYVKKKICVLVEKKRAFVDAKALFIR
jgi:hypothetical protein